MTLPEVLLWQELRKRPGDLRFRRQHPAGVYVLDFFCPRHRLAIEVDGEAHNRGDRPERDAVRSAWLAGEGIKVIRIPALTCCAIWKGSFAISSPAPDESYPSVSPLGCHLPFQGRIDLPKSAALR
jgi:hypothetical protein